MISYHEVQFPAFEESSSLTQAGAFYGAHLNLQWSKEENFVWCFILLLLSPVLLGVIGRCWYWQGPRQTDSPSNTLL